MAAYYSLLLARPKPERSRDSNKTGGGPEDPPQEEEVLISLSI